MGEVLRSWTRWGGHHCSGVPFSWNSFHTSVNLSVFNLIVSMKIFHSSCCCTPFSSLEFLLYPPVSLTRHSLSPPCQVICFVTSVIVAQHLKSKLFMSVQLNQCFDSPLRREGGCAINKGKIIKITLCMLCITSCLSTTKKI